MDLLTILGSPRREGSSSRLLRSFCQGFEEEGGNIFAQLGVNSLKLSPCQSCLACSSSGICVIKDDMLRVEKHLAQVDALVIASPVFFYGFPAQFKALIDRSQAAWYREKINQSLGENPKPAWAILIGETSGPKLFDGMLLTLKYFLQVHGFYLMGSNLVREFSENTIKQARFSGRALMKGDIQ